MKISETIEKLEEILKLHGDLEVCCPSKLIEETNRVHYYSPYFIKEEKAYDSATNDYVNIQKAVVIYSEEIYEDVNRSNTGSCISGLIKILISYKDRDGDIEVVTSLFEGPTKKRNWTRYSVLHNDDFSIFKKDRRKISCISGSMKNKKVDNFWPEYYPKNLKTLLYIGGEI